MDEKVKKTIEDMLHQNVVRSDTWIARRVEGASPEMVRGVRLIMECQRKLPRIDRFVDSNGRVWPREINRQVQFATL